MPVFGNIFLAIGALLVFGGVFGLIGAVMQRSRSYEYRTGRLLRSFLVEGVGLAFVVLALQLGSKPPLVLPALFGTMGVAGLISGLHHTLQERGRI